MIAQKNYLKKVELNVFSEIKLSIFIITYIYLSAKK
jgi:hypothetical protein